MSVTGERYQGPSAPVSAFYDVCADFYAFFGENRFRGRLLEEEGVWPVSFRKIFPKPVGPARPTLTAISDTSGALARRRCLAFVMLRLLNAC
jgi:hypothetical protein